MRQWWMVLLVGLLGASVGVASSVPAPSGWQRPSPFKELRFYYQPYETSGIACQHEELETSHDYFVKCGEREFDVHFFARPHRHPQQDSLEILMMVLQRKKLGKPHTSTVSVWVFSGKGNESQNLLVSLGVENDTASLDVRATF